MEVCDPARLEAPSLDEDHPKVSHSIVKHLTRAFSKHCSNQLQHQ